MKDYKEGLKAGIPIGLGYLSVSITFGIMAVSLGLYWWQALLISMLTLTSAGQLAAIQIMVNPARYIEMIVSQSTINVRYSFMSISLSQKTDHKFKGIWKFLLGFFITDEIFAVAIQKEEVKRSFFIGLSTLPYFGWAIGTLIGTIIGNVIPEIIMKSLCLAIYGMFIAIITPVAKKSKAVLISIIIASLLSLMFYYIPLIKEVPTGIAISISAVLASTICAILFPVKVGEENE